MTLYSTKDLSIEIDLFSAKLGTVTSMPVYILYLDDNDKKIYLGNRLSGSIIDAKTVYLEEFLKYHPANIKCDFVALQILVEDGFEILSVGLGGK